jgi:hypothetical protein
MLLVYTAKREMVQHRQTGWAIRTTTGLCFLLHPRHHHRTPGMQLREAAAGSIPKIICIISSQLI